MRSLPFTEHRMSQNGISYTDGDFFQIVIYWIYMLSDRYFKKIKCEVLRL